ELGGPYRDDSGGILVSAGDGPGCGAHAPLGEPTPGDQSRPRVGGRGWPRGCRIGDRDRPRLRSRLLCVVADRRPRGRVDRQRLCAGVQLHSKPAGIYRFTLRATDVDGGRAELQTSVIVPTGTTGPAEVT